MLIIGLLVDLAISECLHSRMHKNLLGEGLGSAYLRGEDARVFRSPAENAEASGGGGTPSAARPLRGQEQSALRQVANGSHSYRRAMRHPPGAICRVRIWGSWCPMGSANPISATNALIELRAQSGPVPK